jgi:integrase
MMGLQWADVDFAASLLHVPREITKNGRARDIPLNDAALSALHELKERAPTAKRVLSGLGYGGGTLGRRFGEAVASAGIADVTLHTLRHTFATRLKDAGVDPFTVRDLHGHATIQMTNHYTHATPETMRRGVQALSEATGERTRIVPSHLREIA